MIPMVSMDPSLQALTIVTLDHSVSMMLTIFLNSSSLKIHLRMMLMMISSLAFLEGEWVKIKEKENPWEAWEWDLGHPCLTMMTFSAKDLEEEALVHLKAPALVETCQLWENL